MVSHFCICWWTGFPLSKAINVFLPVTLARVCQLLIYDRMSLMITPFDSRAHAFSLGSLGCQPIGWARGRRVLGSSQRGSGLVCLTWGGPCSGSLTEGVRSWLPVIVCSTIKYFYFD